MGESYSEALAALDETGSGGVDVGFGVAGNGGIAVDDDVVVREDAGCICLRVEDGCDGYQCEEEFAGKDCVPRE